jgi:hypothetical protein
LPVLSPNDGPRPTDALATQSLNAICLHQGSQANAFEKLCCQSANDEPIPHSVKFDRKGAGGDGGMECFAPLADGAEEARAYYRPGALGRARDQAALARKERVPQ